MLAPAARKRISIPSISLTFLCLMQVVHFYPGLLPLFYVNDAFPGPLPSHMSIRSIPTSRLAQAIVPNHMAIARQNRPSIVLRLACCGAGGSLPRLLRIQQGPPLIRRLRCLGSINTWSARLRDIPAGE